MTPDITLERAREILILYAPDFVGSLKAVLKDWNEGLGQFQVAMDASTRAHIHNQLFYHHFGLRIATVSQIRFGKDQQQRYLIVNDQVLLRAKLLDRRLRASNFQTVHTTEWSQQAHLPEIPPVPRLNFGYRLDLTGTAIKDAFITMPNGDPHAVNDWVWQLYGQPIVAFGQQRRLFPTGEVFQYDDFSRAV